MSEEELERLREERDRAVAARDALVREMLVPGGQERSALPLGRVLVWFVALLLLGAVGLLVSQMYRTTRMIAEEEQGRPAPAPAPAKPRPHISVRRLVEIPITELDLLTRAALAADGTTVALGGLDGKIALFDLRHDRTVRRWRAHQGGVRDLLFSADGKHLISGGADGAVRSWTLSGPIQSRVIRRSGAPVRDLALCGGQLVVAAEQPEVELIPQEGKPRRLTGHAGWVRTVACTADGRLLASGGDDGKIHLWELPQGKPRPPLEGHKLWVSALAFSPDGRLLASGGFDRRVRLWDVARGKQLRLLRGHVRWIRDLAFDPSGKRLVSAGVDRTALVWDAGGSLRARLEGHHHALNTALFLPRGRVVLTASSDGSLRLWPVPLPTAPSRTPLPPPGPGEITLRRYTDGQRMRVRVVDDKGEVLERGRQQLAQILRSGPDDRAAPPRPELVQLLYKVADHFGRQHEVWVISGYRSPEYNELRTRQSRQVGKESRHMKGEAIDIRIDGVTITALHRYVRGLKAGGVGFYPDSQFIHMDIGPVRHWKGD